MMHRTRTPTGDGYSEITLPSKPYKVFVSGGFDSALLLYILCEQARDCQQEKVHAVVVDRGFASVDFARSVCRWAETAIGISVDLEVLSIPADLPHGQQINEPARLLHARGLITISADTQNPPEVKLPGVAPNRIPPNSRYDNWLFPFAGVDKSHTVSLAKRLGILDAIAEITHTCTETNGVRCGCCWQCSERAWAFDLLQLEDTGQY